MRGGAMVLTSRVPLAVAASDPPFESQLVPVKRQHARRQLRMHRSFVEEAEESHAAWPMQFFSDIEEYSCGEYFTRVRLIFKDKLFRE